MYQHQYHGIDAFTEACEPKEDVECLLKLSVLRRNESELPMLVEAIERRATEDTTLAGGILSTVHRAKGLSFDNVLLTDDLLETDGGYYLTEEGRNNMSVAVSCV